MTKIPGSLRSRLKEMKNTYIGEADESEKYIYTNDRHFIPNAIRKILRMKLIHPDRRVRRYGRIKAHIFYYITGPMIFITMALLYVIVQSAWTLLVFLETNVYLNGLIVSLAIFAILRIYYNSFLIFKASSFLRQLERTIAKDNVTSRDIENLRIALEKKGELFNTFSMAEVIENYAEFKHFNINDTQARFIKSKLGYRLMNNRKGVNFIAGLLVMLGLLGTFLGLLGTIDAVGKALDGMANLGGDGGDIGMDEMSSFIGSLAAPLQGMGLAFSSSLFGLTGSLLIGFFLHLAATPQNYFVENVSRWIDDRVQKFDPKKLAEKAKSEKEDKSDKTEDKPAPQVKATDHDLKDWLTGYVYLTTETNKTLLSLVDAISSVGDGIGGASDELKNISKHQITLIEVSRVFGNTLGEIVTQAQGIKVSIADVQNLTHAMNIAMTSVDITNKNIADTMPVISSSLDVIGQDNKKYASAIYKALKTIDAGGTEIKEVISAYAPALSSIEKSIGVMNEQSIEVARHEITQAQDVQVTLKSIEGILQGIERINNDNSEKDNTQKTLRNIEVLLGGMRQSNIELAQAINGIKTGRTPSSEQTRFSFFSKKKTTPKSDFDSGDL